MVAALAAPTPATATAATYGGRQTSTLKFTAKRPGTPSGLITRFDYTNPSNPYAKPPAVRKVVETLARGGRFDTSAPGPCAASDAELMLLGSGACPASSVIGDGVITVDTGLPGPARIVTSDTTFLNDTGEDIFVNTVRGTPARVIVRATVGKRTRTTVTSFLPGTLPDGGAVSTVTARDLRVVRTVDGKRRAYVTTPPHCPRRGYWTNRVSFTYYDGVTQTVRSRSPCERH